MPIENRALKSGIRLVARYHKQPYTCEVVEEEGGKVRYRLQDGREFKSPSAAGTAITGKACNGWAFWSLETATPPAAPTVTQVASPEKPAEDAPPAAEASTTPASEGPKDAATEPAPTAPETPAPAATEEASQTKRSFYRLPNQKGHGAA